MNTKSRRDLKRKLCRQFLASFAHFKLLKEQQWKMQNKVFYSHKHFNRTWDYSAWALKLVDFEKLWNVWNWSARMWAKLWALIGWRSLYFVAKTYQNLDCIHTQKLITGRDQCTFQGRKPTNKQVVTSVLNRYRTLSSSAKTQIWMKFWREFLYEMQMWFTFYKYPKTVERITIT